MNFIDLGIIIIIGAFVLFGLYFGFVHTVGSSGGAVFSLFASSWIFRFLGLALSYGIKVVVFIAFFLLISRLIGFFVSKIEFVFRILSFLPLVGTANRLAGAVFGLAEGIVVCFAILFAVLRAFPPELVNTWSSESLLLPIAMSVLDIMRFALPSKI